MPTRYDVGLDADGDLPQSPALITGADQVAQAIAVALRLYKGEYFVKGADGLDYNAWTQTKPFPLGALDAAVRRTVIQVPGVLQITDYRSSQTGETVSVSMDVLIDVDQRTLRVTTEPDAPVNAWPQWNVLLMPC